VAQKLPLILTFSPEGRRNSLCRGRFPIPLPSWIPAFARMTASFAFGLGLGRASGSGA
jgi:hypothetical protein